jgi:predicted permease
MMRDLLEALSRLIAILRRRTLDREFDDEFAAHLELLTHRNERRGLARDEARRQAILQMGGLNATKDLHRQARGLPRLDRALEALGGVRRDLIHAVRSLAKAPGFTFVCVASLSIGMGAVVAIPYFSRLLFAPPAGVNTDGLVELLMTPRGPLRIELGESAVEGWSYPDYADLRDADTGMAITGWTEGEAIVALPTPNRAERETVPAMFVSASYFRTVGVTLARGSGFGPERGWSAEPVVILGHGFWQNRLGSDPDIVGKTLTLDGMPHVVVGVAREGYCSHLGECPGTQLFVPLERHPRVRADGRLRFDREITWVRMHGRLSPGITLAQANAAVSNVLSRLAELYPATNKYKAASVEPYFAMGAQARFELRLVQGALFALTGMVLLVVCLNISGMMQARSAIRERELSIRQAIGASRARLVWYLLVEAIMLAGLGGTLAALVLFGTPQVLAWWFSVPIPPPHQEALRPSLPIVALALGLCLVTSLVFGLLPAIRFSRPTLVSALKDDTGGGGRRVGRVHRLAAALQVGIAIPFLIVSGSMVDWVRTTTMGLGFDPEGLAASRLDLNRRGEREDSGVLLRRVREDLEQASGVRSVAIADAVPLDFQFRAVPASRPGHSDVVYVRPARVGDRYLETLDIPLLRGRAITVDDVAGAEAVAVISKPVADRLFGIDDPIGERLTVELEEKAPRVFTIVGVTADFVGRSLDAPRTHVLVPLAQQPASSVFLVARAAAGIEPGALSSAFQNAVRALDADFPNPGNPIGSSGASFMTGDQFKRAGRDDILVPSALVGGGGGAVLTLAALGIYGVIGFMVATRTREIAVRVALGASRRRVFRTIESDVVKLIIPGLVGGLLLSLVLVRLVVPWRGVSGAVMEPLIYTLGAAIAVLVALAAGLPPARRAASVEPMVAMRSE